jgi:hypothetical protein
VEGRVARRAAKAISAVQPYCHEQILAALPWSRTRTTRSDISEILSPRLLKPKETQASAGVLPDPVLIAVGGKTIYCFDFSPRLSGFKVKRQAACWARNEVTIAVERANAMTYMMISTHLGERHALEVFTVSVPQAQLVDAFLDAIGPESVERLYLGY